MSILDFDTTQANSKTPHIVLIYKHLAINWWAGRESNPDLQLRTLPCWSVTLPALMLPTHGARAGNPTRTSSLGRKRHRALDHASLTLPKRMWRGCRELNSDLKVRSLAPSSVGPHPHIGGGREIRTLIVLVKTRGRSSVHCSVMLCRLFANVTLVRDVGIEPTSSRLKGECISLSANPANLVPAKSPQNLVGDAGIEPAWSRLRGECISHLCQSPIFNINMFNSTMVQDVGIEPTPRGYRPRARPST
jgi:hypothetical protein